MNKLGKLELNLWTVGLALVALYVIAAPFRVVVDGIFAGIGKPITPSGVPTIKCYYDGAVMTLGPVEKKYAPTTSVTGTGIRVYINGKDRGIKQSDGTMDVTSEDEVALYYQQNATIGETMKSRYYSAKHEFVVPCTSAFSTADDNVDPNNMHELIAATFPTITVFNDDDGLKNDNTNNETMTSNDVANLELKLVHGNKAGWSPYGSQLITFIYNGSLYSDVELTGIQNVASVSDTSTPSFRVSSGTLGSRAGYTMKTFKTPGVSGLSPVTQLFNVYVETGSAAPVGAGVAGRLKKAAINVSIDDENWYQNTDDGKMYLGAEDDTFAAVGIGSAPNATIRITG